MKTRIGFCFLLVVMLLLQASLWAQSQTTLLATTDLDCTWKLDGASQGTLQADDSKVVSLSLGKHLVQATSADGLDKWRAVITVTQAGQELVEIKLKEARQMRMAAAPPAPQPEAPPSQPAIETAAQPAAQPTPQPAVQPAVQPAGQPAAQPAAQPTPQPAAQPTPQPAVQPTPQPAVQPVVERAAPAKTQPTQDLTWTDPATHLMWTGKDNGKNLTWEDASHYCSALKLEGYSNWRLPTVNELAGIYDETQDVNGFHVKGAIRVTGWEWSSEARDANDHQLFTFHDVKKELVLIAFSRRALCVRLAGQ